MNAVMDWPTLSTDAPAPQPSGAVTVADLTPIALARFGDWKAEARRLVETYRGVVYECRTTKGREEAEKARAAVRAPRYAAQRVAKASKSELAKVSKAVGAEEQAIIAYLAETEEHIDAQIRADDARREAEKAERERIEAARRAKHEAGIATICSYADRCAGLSSERIAAGIAQLDAIPITDSWEDFKERATLAQQATLAKMRDLYAKALIHEDDMARLEAQRIENERIAAEQAAERQRIAEAAAKVKADAEALQKRINEQAEREARAAAQATADRDADAALRARIEVQVEAELAAQRAEAEALGVRLPDSSDDDDYSITIGLADEKPLYAPLRVEPPAVTFAEPEPAGDVFETLAWHDADKVRPDDSKTVLCWGREGFFCGFWQYGAGWIGCESGGSVSVVTHWAEPKGPASA